MRSLAISQLIVCCMLAGCAGSKTVDDNGSPTNSSGTTIRGSEMAGNILNALRTRIPSIRVTATDACPRIAFRGALSMSNQPNPSIYVDGTLMGDSCVLTSINGQDVDRVEVFPSGDTPYATIRRNASGIILIFRRKE